MTEEIPNFKIKLIGGILDGERFPIYGDNIPANINLTYDESLQKDKPTQHYYKLHFLTTTKNEELDLLEMAYRYVGAGELPDDIKQQMLEDL